MCRCEWSHPIRTGREPWDVQRPRAKLRRRSCYALQPLWRWPSASPRSQSPRRRHCPHRSLVASARISPHSFTPRPASSQARTPSTCCPPEAPTAEARGADEDSARPAEDVTRYSPDSDVAASGWKLEDEAAADTGCKRRQRANALPLISCTAPQRRANLASSLPSCDLPSTTSLGCSARISCASLSSTPARMASRSIVRQLYWLSCIAATMRL